MLHDFRLVKIRIRRLSGATAIGDATLGVDLDTADGTASLDSLVRHAGTGCERFAGGALHHLLAPWGNALAATHRAAMPSAELYGPGHDAIAGTLNGANAGLLATFGALRDARPAREDLGMQATVPRRLHARELLPTRDGVKANEHLGIRRYRGRTRHRRRALVVRIGSIRA